MPGISGSSSGRAFPSGNSEAPRGISGPRAPSFPADQQPGPALTYRAGEESRLRASQSMDPMDPAWRGSAPYSLPQPNSVSGAGGMSGMSGSTSGIRPVLAPRSETAAHDGGRQSGSRLWIVAVLILVALVIAAIVLLRMAQLGVFLSL